MLTSEHPSLLPSTLDQYSTGETSYRSYQEMPYAQQCDTRALECNEQHPDKISLRVYDRKSSDIVTALIDVVIDISLCSVIRNDETVCYIESIDNDFMNHMPSDTTRTVAREPRLPICSNILDLQTFLHSVTYPYVRAYMCQLVQSNTVSTLIAFDLEHIDLCTLHIPGGSCDAEFCRMKLNSECLPNNAELKAE